MGHAAAYGLWLSLLVVRMMLWFFVCAGSDDVILHMFMPLLMVTKLPHRDLCCLPTGTCLISVSGICRYTVAQL
jgi:hypothetical protein